MKFFGLGIYRNVKNSRLNQLGRKYFGLSYEPNRYWKKAGELYMFTDNQFDETVLLNTLKNISFDSVLEFGCGYGRVTKKIIDNFKVDNYVAFDLSPHQLHFAKMNCPNVEFHNTTIQQFSIDQKFDLVIGFGVLQHILPEEIEDVIKRLATFSKKYFVHITPNYKEDFTPTRLTRTFYHNFLQIYENIEEIKETEIIPQDDEVSIHLSTVQNSLE